MTDSIHLISKALAGRYTVERQVGEGGFATVYLAKDERHRREVAVKVLRPELARSIGLDRFGREIEIAARLNHPHILPLLDSGTINAGDGLPATAYYVMPFVTGESLRQRLARTGRLEPPEALRFGREVAGALDYAHRQGVIHRDIKPENILLSDGHAVITDFGIARAIDEAGGGNQSTGLTGVDQLLGTPTYMSPEQVAGEQSIDGRSDIYSLGCTLFETLVGQPPWTGSNPANVMARRLTQRAPRIRSILATIPQPVDDALAKALAIDPDQRFATAAEFGAALEGGVVARPAGKRTAVIAAATAAAVFAALFITSKFARAGRADAVTALAIAPQQADSAVQYLSEGIQEGVADQLRKLPQLRVLAPSVVSQVRQQQPTIDNEELGRRLRVNAVLTWELTRTRDSVRVRAELLRVPGADLLWSVRLARPASDLSMIAGTLAHMIADSLRLQLTGSERAQMARVPTSNAAAYDLYIRGRRYQLRAIPLGATGAPEALDSVWSLGRQAIALDSNFAPAWSLLGMYYLHNAMRGFRQPFAAYIDSGLAFSRRATELDSTIGDPWVALISKAMYIDDDWPRLLDVASRAGRLSRFDPTVQVYLGIIAAEVEGRLDSGITLVRQSTDTDPTTLGLNTLGDLYLRTRRNDSAIAVLRRAIAIDASVPGPHRRLVLALERSGRWAEAAEARRYLGDSAAAPFIDGVRTGGPAGYQQALQRELRERIDALSRAYTRPYELPRDTVPPTREAQIALLHAQAGNWAEAMNWLIRERERRPRRFRIHALNPDFLPLRQDPRFQQLVREDSLQSLIRRVR